jgi:large subunit ribosomal protein L19e
MIYKTRKRIAARILKCSPKRVWLDPEHMDDIKEALTRSDLRGLIHDGIIKKVQKKGVSRSRAKERHLKKRKGQRSGMGKRKGKATARTPKKLEWMNTIRLLRSYLRGLKEKKLLDATTYRDLYRKSKGGFFRSKRHLSMYMAERNLQKKDSK